MPIGFPLTPPPTVGQLHPVVNPTHRYSGTLWVPLGGTPINQRYDTIGGNTDFIGLVAGVPGMVAASVIAAYTGGSPAPSRPAVMTVGQWTATPIVGGLAIDIDIAPAGSPTGYERSLDNGVTWAALADGAALGVRNITGLAATARQVRVRGVNAVGAALAPGSDTKTATPLASGGGSAAYLGQQVFTGSDTVATTIPAGVTATDRVYAILAGGEHGISTTALATYGGPAGWTPEDSATAGTSGNRLLSAPGNVANLSFSSPGLRSVTLIGVRGTRRASAMVQRYWDSEGQLHTSPSATAVEGDLVISAIVQQDGSAPAFGAPTTGYSPAFTKVDAAPFVRIATRSNAPAGPTGLLSAGGGADWSSRTILTLVIQP